MSSSTPTSAAYVSRQKNVGPPFQSAWQPPAPPPPPKPSQENTQFMPRRVSPIQNPTSSTVGNTRCSAKDTRLVDGTQRLPLSEDEGQDWVPVMLTQKSKPQLVELLEQPHLLPAIAHASATMSPSIAALDATLAAALDDNIALANHLRQQETILDETRSATQARLLAAHALERQWHLKQVDMDRALSPVAPSSLYQQPIHSIQEQENICSSLEDTFLEANETVASEREVSEWVRSFREAKRVYYSRLARKERWDEGRVGGWR